MPSEFIKLKRIVHDGREEKEMQNELKPNLLKNWEIQKYWDGSMVIRGDIYNDSRGRFKDGTPIRTSKLKYVDFEKLLAKTKNSLYNLDGRSNR